MCRSSKDAENSEAESTPQGIPPEPPNTLDSVLTKILLFGFLIPSSTLLINMPERKNNARRVTVQHATTVYAEHEDEAKENNGEKSELEKRYQEIIDTIKKAAAKKEKEAHDTRNDGAESTLVENVAQETEGKSKKRSSNDEQRDAAAVLVA